MTNDDKRKVYLVLVPGDYGEGQWVSAVCASLERARAYIASEIQDLDEETRAEIQESPPNYFGVHNSKPIFWISDRNVLE